MVLILDNYDSFVHNVARYLRRLGAEVRVVRSDALTPEQALALDPGHIVISPGPCTPAQAGISVEVVRAAAGRIPILGICLGHQAIAEAFGGEVGPCSAPVHGRASRIHHAGEGLFEGMPNPFAAGRYHSLCVPKGAMPAELEVAAWTEEGEVMAIRHRERPVWGLQFHPESILTERGEEIFRAFLALGGSRA